jgi:hypothetical protein
MAFRNLDIRLAFPGNVTFLTSEIGLGRYIVRKGTSAAIAGEMPFVIRSVIICMTPGSSSGGEHPPPAILPQPYR